MRGTVISKGWGKNFNPLYQFYTYKTLFKVQKLSRNRIKNFLECFPKNIIKKLFILEINMIIVRKFLPFTPFLGFLKMSLFAFFYDLLKYHERNFLRKIPLKSIFELEMIIVGNFLSFTIFSGVLKKLYFLRLFTIF